MYQQTVKGPLVLALRLVPTFQIGEYQNNISGTINKLTDLALKNPKAGVKTRRMSDGGGLFLEGEDQCHYIKKVKGGENRLDDVYGSLDLSVVLAKYKMPEKEHSPHHIYQVVHDELMLDGNARQNLTTFCTTWLDPEIYKIMAECWRWREKMKVAGKPTDKPNLICGPVQVCWHKFAPYWDVELR